MRGVAKVTWLVQPGGDETEDRLHPGLQLPTRASAGADTDLLSLVTSNRT